MDGLGCRRALGPGAFSRRNMFAFLFPAHVHEKKAKKKNVPKTCELETVESSLSCVA